MHSWAGIGIGREDAKKLAGKLLGQEKLRSVLDRWRRVRTLILDESTRPYEHVSLAKRVSYLVSMIDGVLFDKLVSVCEFHVCIANIYKEFIARMLRNNDKPFGGMQVLHIISVVFQEAHIIASLLYPVTSVSCHLFQTATKTATLYHRSLLLRQTVGASVSGDLLC